MFIPGKKLIKILRIPIWLALQFVHAPKKKQRPDFYRDMPQAPHAINCRRNNHSMIISYAAPCDWRYLSMPI